MLQSRQERAAHAKEALANRGSVFSASDSPASLAAAKKVINRIVAERHDRPSLVAKIASDIGAEIIQGLFRPGDDLNSVELSRRFKTSRTPIREALILLEKEGLVDIPPRRRPRVRTLALDEIKDIYEARAALFVLMGQAVALHASDDDIAQLESLLTELRKCQRKHDVEAFLWANVNFFDLVTQFANNRTIRAILDSLLLRTLPLRRLSLSLPGRLTSSLDDMTRLVRAFRQRDANLAAALIQSNHINALRALLTHLQQNAPATDNAKASGRSVKP
jgi:DNA-binding GntR family transcriptional regulator